LPPGGDRLYARQMNEDIEISTDPARLDIDVIHRYLSEDSYWARGIPLALVKRAVENSLCFGAYLNRRQVGFARVITDRATFAYLADVFVLEPYRGRGYGKVLVQAIMEHPYLQGLRQMLLFTRDAHSLYAPFGFLIPDNPERIMIRRGVTGYSNQT
jgi:GNAT superfamily N-acetyltransferase